MSFSLFSVVFCPFLIRLLWVDITIAVLVVVPSKTSSHGSLSRPQMSVCTLQVSILLAFCWIQYSKMFFMPPFSIIGIGKKFPGRCVHRCLFSVMQLHCIAGWRWCLDMKTRRWTWTNICYNYTRTHNANSLWLIETTALASCTTAMLVQSTLYKTCSYSPNSRVFTQIDWNILRNFPPLPLGLARLRAKVIHLFLFLYEEKQVVVLIKS